MKERVLTALGPLLGLGLFAVAIAVLHREVQEYHYGDVIAHLQAIPPRAAVIAVIVTALGYLCLTGYDALAFRFIRHPLRYPRIALASFVAYVFSHNIGLSFFGGSAVRYRMFTSWGVAPAELGTAITFNVLTFWLGFLSLGGVVLAIDPIRLPEAWHPVVATTRPLGLIFLGAVAAWWLASLRRQRTLHVRGFELALPGPGMTGAQVLLSSIDWTLAGAALFVLLPDGGPTFPRFLGIFLLAQVAGLVSHVPAGLGVFETAMVLLLSPWLPGDAVLGSVLAYRIVYYLLPMALALPLFAGFEAQERSDALRRVGSAFFGTWVPELIPRALAATTFAAGVILLFSGATPAAPGRFEVLDRLLPLPVMEISHLLGSVIGVALLLLARSVQQRVDAAYLLTLTLLVGGAIASLLKGLDWEEALVLSAMAAALLPCRRYFYRKSALLTQSFSPAWTAGIALIFVATFFVLLLAHRQVEYSNRLWWEFTAEADTPRSLRAVAAGAVALGAFALARLLRPVAPIAPPPTPDELTRAAKLVAVASSAEAHLALLGDKRLLFHESGEGFLMYGVQRRSWVAMGDPVGPREVRRELAWEFRELADQHGGLAVFYEVAAEDLPVYLDLGLDLRKLGEEARVPLEGFSLAGGPRRGLRNTQSRMAREGVRFELVPREAVRPLLPELRAVSDAWLASKSTREKRFSLGYFEPEYLSRCPMGLARQGDRIVAFANVWAPERRDEISLDMMRFADDAPPGVMDFLFTELMLWGRDQGYRWFGLGMAPFSGFEHHRLAPVWNRLGALLFRHGEQFYNFRGLRAFKDKFDPVWEPRYLASPGGLALPFVLTDVASLISGGVTGVVAR